MATPPIATRDRKGAASRGRRAIAAGIGAATRGRTLARLAAPRSSALLLGIGGMLILLAIKVPTYVTVANLEIVGLQITTVGIAAIGTAFLLISGNVDLSIGSLVGLIAVSSAMLAKTMPAPAALVLGVALATAIGLANGLLVWRISTSPIIITLGSLSLLYGVALLLSHGVNVPDVPDAYTQLGRAHVLGIPSALLAFIVIAIGAALFLATTVPGRHLYAIGGNREASLRVGIRLRRIVLAAFAFNGLLVGLAAIFEASRFGTASPEFGIGLEVDVITAVILGGVAFWGGEGTLTGVLLAVIFLGILESGLVSLGIDPFYADVVRGGALIVAVSLEQFSRERRERQRKALAMAERGP